MTQETEREALFRRYFKLGQDMSALKAFNIVLDEAIDRASLGKGEAKPVKVEELAAVISDAVHDNPFSIFSEKSPLTAEQERKRASAILSRYNVTLKESV